MDKIFYQWLDKSEEVAHRIIEDFKSNPLSRQKWRVIPAARIKKIWLDFAKHGFVRDEKGLDYIVSIIIENVHKLNVNTTLAGHTELPVSEYVGDLGVEFDNESRDEFADHILDDSGAWRISDYALNPLIHDSQLLMQKSDPTRKLMIVDRMLNRVHARSDVASLFIEGGSKTLTEMSR